MNIIFNSLLAQLVKYDVHTTRKIKFIHAICYHILLFFGWIWGNVWERVSGRKFPEGRNVLDEWLFLQHYRSDLSDRYGVVFLLWVRLCHVNIKNQNGSARLKTNTLCKTCADLGTYIQISYTEKIAREIAVGVVSCVFSAHPVICTERKSVKRDAFGSGPDRQRSRFNELRAIPGHVTSRDLRAFGLMPARRGKERVGEKNELGGPASERTRSRWITATRVELQWERGNLLGVPLDGQTTERL